MSRIYLSHSHENGREAMALKEWLVEQAPELDGQIYLYSDPRDGNGAEEQWTLRQKAEMERSQVVLFLATSHWMDSTECRSEFRIAQALGKDLITARLDDAVSIEELGKLTHAWVVTDLFGDGPLIRACVGEREREVVFNTAGLTRILKAVRAPGSGPESFRWPPETDKTRAPYRGWDPLQESDAAVFFGRDAQILRGLAELRRMRESAKECVFVIVGPSGAGKSSFLRAGLMPRLRRDDRNFWLLGIVRPEQRPLTGDHGLARAINEMRGNLGLNTPTLGQIKTACASGDVDGVWKLLTEAREEIRSRLLDASEGTPPPTLIMPLDQTEELFSVDSGPEAIEFLKLLGGLLRRGSASEGVPALTLACTIRTDRYEYLQTAPDLADLPSVVFGDLRPMHPAEFKEVICGPAKRAIIDGKPLSVTEGLVERLLAETAHGGDALPLLALTMSRLYADYAGDGDLTVEEYEEMGGMRRVVQTGIDSVLSRYPGTRQDGLRLLHDIFIPSLVTINDQAMRGLTEDEPTRRIANWEDLRDRLPADALLMLDELVTQRFLVKYISEGKVFVEVALENLFHTWDDLAEWVASESKDLKDAGILRRGARQWESSGGNQEYLLRGERLNSAEDLADRHPEWLKEDARRFVSESRAAANKEASEDRRRSRLLRAITGLAVTSAVFATILAIVALFNWSQVAVKHNQSMALALSVASRDLIDANDPFAVALAAEAMSFTPTPLREALGALVDARVVLGQRRVLPFGKPLAGHHGNVYACAFSPDSNLLASAGQDGTVRMWDPATGQSVGEPLTGHVGGVRSVAFTPSREDAAMTVERPIRLASAGEDGTIRLWDPAEGTQIRKLPGHRGWVYSVAFSPSGNLLASGGQDGTIRLWDPADGTQIRKLTGDDEVYSVAFSPTGNLLASGDQDGTIRLWNPADGTQIRRLTGHDGQVRSVAFSRDGKLLASAGQNGNLRLWDPADGTQIRKLTGHKGRVRSAAFSSDGNLLASGSQDSTMRLWDPANSEPADRPLTGLGGWIYAVAFSLDGKYLASAGQDGMVRLWGPVSADPAERPMAAHTAATRFVTYRPDHKNRELERPALLASASEDNTIRLWDPDTGKPVGKPLTGHQGWVVSLTFSPDGTQLASASYDRTIKLWDPEHPERGEPIRTLKGHKGRVRSVAFRPSGRSDVTSVERPVLLASAGEDGRILLWDPERDKPIGTLTGHKGWVRSVAFSPDGNLLASAGQDGTIRLWNPEKGVQVGESLRDNAATVVSVAFSPDGSLLASGGNDGKVVVWDLATMTKVATSLTGHSSWVRSVAFSPDGTLLASAGDDGTVRLWDPATGRPIGHPLTRQKGWIFAVAFSPDGRLLASAIQDGTVRQWRALWDLERSCSLASPYLTIEELKSYPILEFQPLLDRKLTCLYPR